MKFRLPIASGKKYLSISIILILLMIVVLSGYLSSADNRETSVRILIDGCGGKVVFSHLVHQKDYKISCVNCHYEKGGDQADYIACGLCHPVAFDKNYIEKHKKFFPDKKTCVRCHHLEFFKAGFEHSEHESYASD
ncbi:MAG: cytochrome c3 family protein [Thermodesulfobacteriota bacterium]|nr:cytochrome c3 family protein [Thermodesulfobacteriota bacterium]